MGRASGAGIGSVLATAMCGAFAVIGCGPATEREEPPPLYLDPDSALSQTSLAVQLAVDGVDLAECANMTPEALVFGDGVEDSGIQVHSLQALDATTLRADITVAMEAALGTCAVSYECAPNAVYTGAFEVRGREEEPLLALDPAAAPAGSSNLLVAISAQDIAFIENVSHVVFGDGTHVAVKDEEIVGETGEMFVTIDISPLAPTGPMEVAVVTGSIVARGSFEVEERIFSSISVSPDRIVRPAPGEAAAQATLEISGEGTLFEAAVEGDAGAAEGSVVSFPGNPGITVTATSVNGPTGIVANIMVDDKAALGPWPLRVTTGDDAVTTAFTVRRQAEAPALTLAPCAVTRGEDAGLLIARVVGAKLDAGSTASFVDTGCYVLETEVLGDDVMAVRVEIEDTFAPNAAVLEVTTVDAGTLAAYVVVEEPVGLQVSAPTPSSVSQGYSGWVSVVAENGLFSDFAAAEVQDRSGIWLEDASTAFEGEVLILVVEVAADAPVGPAPVRLVDGVVERSILLEVTPSGVGASAALEPSILLAGRNTASSRLVTGGMTLAQEDARVDVDDPGVSIEGVDVTDASTAAVTMDVAPTVPSGSAVAHVRDGDQRAAASLLVIGRDAPTAKALDAEIERGAQTRSAFVHVDVTGMTLTEPTAQVMDGIGVRVVRTSIIDASTFDLELELEVQSEEEGAQPHGWFGVVIADKGARAILPLLIDGVGQPLTMAITPDEGSPGLQAGSFVATPPSIAVFDEATCFAATDLDGAWVTLAEVSPDDGWAEVLLDLSYGLDAAQDDVPVYLSLAHGAAVGFVEAAALETATVTPTSDWEDALLDGQTLLVLADVADGPAVVSFSEGRDGFADADVALLDDFALSTRRTGEAGGLFVLDPGAFHMAVSAAGATGGDPSAVSVESKGGAILDLLEPDDTAVGANVVPVDPCEIPFLAEGVMDRASDTDRARLGATACRLVAVVVADGAAAEPWMLPDAKLAVASAEEVVMDVSLGWPTANGGDPRLYLDPDMASRQILVTAEAGTEGPYLLNIRRAGIIREACMRGAEPFVELELEPGIDISALSLELVDADTGLVLAALPLSGIVPADGLVVVGDGSAPWVDVADTAGVTVVAPGDPFVVRLVDGAGKVDAVQVGGTGDLGEGEPVADGGALCYYRFANVDSGDNLFDFAGAWVGTPGS